MPTMISIGYPQTMVAGTVYALPAQACQMSAFGTGANGTGATIDLSNDGTLFATGVATPFNAVVSHAFVRCSTTNCVAQLNPIR